MNELIESAERVFEELGPGWTESIYHRAMEVELSRNGIEFSSESTIPVMYRGKSVGRRRPDMLVESANGTIIIELKAGSSSGENQLFDYHNILSDDSNYDISGAMLIRFNDELEVVKS